MTIKRKINKRNTHKRITKRKKQHGGVIPPGYKFEKSLGQGATGKVDLVSKQMALKQINGNLLNVDPSLRYRVDNEVKILKKIKKQCNNEPIICIEDDFIDKDGNFYIGLEVLPTSLKTVLNKKKINDNELIFIIKKIIRGIYFLHSNKIAHQDLKPENILVFIDTNYTVTNLKIIDFDTACDNDNDMCDIIGSSPMYMSPELAICANQDWIHKTIIYRDDIWALAIIILRMILGYDEFIEILNIPKNMFIQSFVYNDPLNFVNKLKLKSNQIKREPIIIKIYIYFWNILYQIVTNSINMQKSSCKIPQDISYININRIRLDFNLILKNKLSPIYNEDLNNQYIVSSPQTQYTNYSNTIKNKRKKKFLFF
jgi:serine/threonine protein kinase